jgi:hypothetical protein
MTDRLTSDETLLTRRELAAFLTDNGRPISHSTLAKYCSPAINTGPPAECWWGKLPLYRPSRALEWARSRERPVKVPPTTECDRAAASKKGAGTRAQPRDQQRPAAA